MVVKTTAGAETPLGLYLHIPFCEKKCIYCDFNTYAGLQDHFQALVDALCQEMSRWREPLGKRSLCSIFIGGGTPTVLSTPQLTQLFSVIQANFHLTADCEITCEANPGTVDRAKFQLLHELGVNRLSLGVQSFQPQELAFLGRIHTVADVLEAYATARKVGFTNINLDFIFGLPNQTLDDWAATLEQALLLQPEHLSLYSLIVEPNTPLHHWVERGSVAAPDEDLAAEQYELAMATLATAGYGHYEVSNWARLLPDEPPTAVPTRASRHNLLYWRNQEYVGIGPGAHSHLREQTGMGYRWGNRKPVPSYIKRVLAGQSIEEFREEIGPALAMGETMMLGLRVWPEGVGFAEFQARHGQDLRTVFANELRELQAAELLLIDQERVRLSPQGLLLGNQVFARFLPN
jgi:oxygen-independent coproporphyrinogen-3 oxidase